MPFIVSMLKMTARKSMAISSPEFQGWRSCRRGSCSRSCPAAPGRSPTSPGPRRILPPCSSCFCTSASGVLVRIHGKRGPHLSGQFQTKWIQIRDHHMPCTCVLHHRYRHDADRTGAGDEHVFAQNRKRKRGMNRISKRIEDRRNFLIDARMVPPDIGHRQRDQLGKGPGRLTPTPCVSAQRCRLPARQFRHLPHTTCPSPLTMSPGKKSLTFDPTSTISPTNS